MKAKYHPYPMTPTAKGTKRVNSPMMEIVADVLREHARPGVFGQIRIEAPRVRRKLQHRPDDFSTVKRNEIESSRAQEVARVVECIRVLTFGSPIGAIVAHFQDGRLMKYEVEDER